VRSALKGACDRDLSGAALFYGCPKLFLGGSEWATYRIAFSVPEELIGIRLDFPKPPEGETVAIDDVRLLRADGGVLTDWTFDPDRARPTTFAVERLRRVGR